MKHIFIRHPPLPDMQGICYGALDMTISEANVIPHALSLKPLLLAHKLISSPLQRCFCLAKAIDASATQDARLIEMSFGDWQGQAWDLIDRHELDAWAQDVANYRAPCGESFMDVINRLKDFLADLNEPHVLITHAGVIRAAYYLLGGISLLEAASQDVPYVTPISF
ncbi:MAG: histidine phosphatase family protein [Arenimonas sp.]